MRRFVITLCMTLVTVFTFSDFSYCQEYRAEGWRERHRIVVLREDKDSVEVAPGEFIAFAGTQYYTDGGQTSRPETEKTSLTRINGYCVNVALVFPWSSWNLSDDPSTWPLKGVNANSEGTAKVTLWPRMGAKSG